MNSLARVLLCFALLTAVAHPSYASNNADDIGISIIVQNFVTDQQNVYLGGGWNMPHGMTRMDVTVVGEPGFIYTIESRGSFGTNVLSPGQYPARWQKHRSQIQVAVALANGKSRLLTFRVVGQRPAKNAQ